MGGLLPLRSNYLCITVAERLKMAHQQRITVVQKKRNLAHIQRMTTLNILLLLGYYVHDVNTLYPIHEDWRYVFRYNDNFIEGLPCPSPYFYSIRVCSLKEGIYSILYTYIPIYTKDWSYVYRLYISLVNLWNKIINSYVSKPLIYKPFAEKTDVYVVLKGNFHSTRLAATAGTCFQDQPWFLKLIKILQCFKL